MNKKMKMERMSKIRIYDMMISHVISLDNIVESVYNHGIILDFEGLKKIFEILKNLYMLDCQVPGTSSQALKNDFLAEVYDPIKNFIVYGERFEDRYDLMSLIFIIKDQCSKIRSTIDKELKIMKFDIGEDQMQELRNEIASGLNN